MSQNLLENLNEEQLVAVTHEIGPLLIIAGAGTGKTTVITQRIAWLIEQQKAKPDEILALTFTEKAATEMEERVDNLLPIGYVDLWISTFHSFCEKILRAHGLDIGISHEFTLLDEVQIFLLIRRNLDRFSLNYYRPRGNPTRFIRALVTHFSRAKDEIITPEAYLALSEDLILNTDSNNAITQTKQAEEGITEINRIAELANAYHTYQQILLENNALDFSDLISYTIELFQKRPNIIKKYQNQFKYILVDEFQDTNSAQYELIKLLVTPPNNITVVGDDDQSIYKFRGASLANIMSFREDFPEAKSIVLTNNYRSGASILDCAYTLIQQNNPHRLEVKEQLNKRLRSNNEYGGEVEYTHCNTLDDEVNSVIDKIIAIQQATNSHWSDFCILTRANDSADPFLARLDALTIPYRFLALSGLYTKPIIIDSLAYLQVINQPHTSPAMYRIISHPALGIENQDITQLTLFTKKHGCSLFDAIKLCQTISEKSKIRLREIELIISELQVMARSKSAHELFVEVVQRTGLLCEVLILNDSQQIEQNEYLQNFYSRIKKFEECSADKSLHGFLEEFEHERESGESGELTQDVELGPDVVNVMTVHASKGLEFPYVFLVNLVEQRFPSQRRADAIELPQKLIRNKIASATDEHIHEERRLFYVALTRAKLGIYLFSASDYGGIRKRKPSRFLAELKIVPRPGLSTNSIQSLISLAKPNRVISDNISTYKLPHSVSFTQIVAFSNCPLQYKYAHILSVPVFGKYQMSFGKSMHATLNKALQLMLDRRDSPQSTIFNEPPGAQLNVLTQKELLDFYKQSWLPEWYPDKKTQDEYFKSGQESLLDLHKQMLSNPPNIAFLEKEFTLKIGNVHIKGRIDRTDAVDGGYEIIDYKTGSPKTEEKLTWEDRRQLVLYALAAEQSFSPPIKIVKLTYLYLENVTSISFVPMQKDKEKLEQNILSIVESIQKSAFTPTPGFHCRYCDFKDICESSEV